MNIRSIQNDSDIDRIAEFNGMIHGDEVDGMTRELIQQHPDANPDHWLFIEDEGKIVSTLCLLSWRWRYEGVELKAGEMGIVGTDAAYRGKGLSRQLAQHHHQLLDAGEYDLSHIQGIPYFYRQFGYEYAIPLEGGHHVHPHTLPDMPDGFQTRRATADDIPALQSLYDEAAQDLTISAVREADHWHYLLGPANKTETASDFWLVIEDERPVAYWRVGHYGFGEGLIVNEVSRLPQRMHPGVLAACKTLMGDKPYVRLNIPRSHPLVATARGFGAQDRGTYAWQIMIPDVGRLLRKLVPVFERRIAASAFAGMTRPFVINLYRRAYELRFENGTVTAVESLGFADERGDLFTPPNMFTPLVFGYRSREEIQALYPDFNAGGENQALVDVLFPKVESFIYNVY